MKYRAILADPPWEMPDTGMRTQPNGTTSGWDHCTGKVSMIPYPTMTLEEIEDLPVDSLAERDAHLYLWTTMRFLEDAFTVARFWRFKPRQVLTWCKPPMGLGFGGAFANTTEFVLFCRRGTLKPLCRVDTTWWEWSRGEHSRKPDAFQDLVEQVSPGPYLELFARRQRLGWDTWGNEALCHVELDGVAA